jgi:shikimate dehydrogenase
VIGINKYIENKIKNKNKNKNKKYTLIVGRAPSKGARSPKLWNKAYKVLNLKVKMEPADLPQRNIKDFFNFIKKDKNFLGGAITAPYKVVAMKYMDKIDKKSLEIGSINIMIRNKKKLIGYNTDFSGCYESLKKIKKKKNVLILGCGGAAKAVILAAIYKFKKTKIFFFNRNHEKLKKFLTKIKLKKNFNFISSYNELIELKNLDLVLNATSVGFDSWIKVNNKYFNLKFFTPLTNLKELKKIFNKNYKTFFEKNRNLIDKDTKILKLFFKKNSNCDVFDIIYKPKTTKLMKFSYQRKNKVYNGLQMNLIQAVKGFMLTNKINNFNLVKKAMVSNG